MFTNVTSILRMQVKSQKIFLITFSKFYISILQFNFFIVVQHFLPVCSGSCNHRKESQLGGTVGLNHFIEDRMTFLIISFMKRHFIEY